VTEASLCKNQTY